MPRLIQVSPSILSADFGRLGEEVRAAEAGGADELHIDVMDGQYVPTISFGDVVVRAVKRYCNLRLDVHLMVVQPDRLIETYAAAGAWQINVHVEATLHPYRTLDLIKSFGVRAALAISPSTPVSLIQDLLPEVSRVLVMTVNPGFGGQKLIPATLRKVRQLRDLMDAQGLDCEISVDGGIDATTAPQAVAAGADVLIAGAAVFGAKVDVPTAIAAIRATYHTT
jgi:ribulose-phosphate 3-epimerase